MSQPVVTTPAGTGTPPVDADTGRDDTDSAAGDGVEDEESDAVLGAKGISALRKLRAENKTLQRQLAEKARSNGPAPVVIPAAQSVTGTAETGSSAPVDEAAIRATIEREYAVKFGAERAQNRAIALLSEARYKGKVERGVKLLDLKNAVKDDGSLDEEALRDAVDDLKEDEPDRFAGEDDEDTTPRVRRQVGSADGGRKKPTTVPKTSAQTLAEKRFGRPARR